MRRPRRRLGHQEQGVAIVAVLLVLAILAVIALGIATMGQGNMAITVAQTNSEKAYMAAEAAALYQCDVFTGTGALTKLSSPTTGWPRPLSSTSSDVMINATIAANSPWGAVTSVIPPGSTQAIALPPEHAYVIGCGNVNSASSQSVVRYVGIMMRKSVPGGVYYYGAYANNTLNVSSNMLLPGGGMVDAWDSKGGTVPYSAGARVPFADLEGSGTNTMVANQTNIYGNVDGPTVNATATNMNNMGTVRQPGTSLAMPTPPWPAMAPSPVTDLIVDGGTRTIGPGEPPPYDNLQWDDVQVRNGGKLILKGVAGGTNFSIHNLDVTDGGVINANVAPPMGASDKFGLYLARDPVGGAVDINSKGKILVAKNGVAADDPARLNIYYNGDSFKIDNDQTKVVGTITVTNTNARTNLFDRAELVGSVISANNITISDNFKLHYDIGLRTAGIDPNGGASLTIVSHQRL